MATIKLTACDVEVVERINWGQKEAIKTAMQSAFAVPTDPTKVAEVAAKPPKEIEFSPDAIMRAKYKMLEVCIVKVVLPDGTEMPYSREWMDNLDPDDGDKLFEAIDAISHPKKK